MKLPNNALKKILKYLMILVLSVVVLLALVISLARFFMPSLDQYEQKIADLIAKELQLNIKFDTFAADWYRFSPALKVTGIVLSTPENVIITEVDTLYVSFNIFDSIKERKPVPSYVSVIGLDIDLVQKDNGVTIRNWPAAQTPQTDEGSQILEALKKYGSIHIRRSRINFEDAMGEQTPIYMRRLIYDRSGRNHQLELMLNLLNHPTRLSLMAQMHGDLTKYKQLDVNGYIELDNIDLGHYLKSYSFKEYAIQKGIGDIEAWVNWNEGQLQELQAGVILENLLVFSGAQKKTLLPINLVHKFLWERKDENTWMLSGEDLAIKSDDHLPLPLLKKYELSQENDTDYHFIGKGIHLGNVTQTVLDSGELAQEQQQLLEKIQPQGELSDLTLNWQNQTWQLGTQFTELDFQGWDHVPGVHNLSGELIANESAGKLRLDSKNTQIDYTAVFPQNLLFNTILGDITWQQSENLWQVQSENIVFENNELTLQTDFLVTGGEEVATHIDAGVSIPKIVSTNLYHYIPVRELSTDLGEWLRESIGPGQLANIELTAHGPANDFPFYDDGDGVFQLNMDLQDLTLSFDPQWPLLENIDGKFQFLGRQIQIVLDNSRIYGTDLYSVSADIGLPAQGPSLLNIHGEALTSSQNAVDFIDHTPLKDTIGNDLDLFVFNFPVTMTLDLQIPLDGDDTTETLINGLIQISEGDVVLKDESIHFDHVNGVLGFTQDNIYSQGIQATFHDKPVLMTITPEDKGKQHLSHWKIQGEMSIPDLNEYFPNVLWDYMKGQSQFSANFTTGDKTKEGFDLVFASDLKGISIDLPAPFAKKADTTATVQYTSTIGIENLTRVRIQFNNLLDALAEFNTVNEAEILKGARIHLGGTLSNLKVPNDVEVSGHLKQFSYDTWKDFIDNFEKNNPPIADDDNKSQSTKFSDIVKKIKQIDVSFDQLEIFDMALKKVKLNLKQTVEKWTIQLKSTDWGGLITIPHAKAPMHLDFDYCTFTKSENKKHDAKIEIDPRTIPSLNFICRDFVYNNQQFKVNFNAISEPMGIKVDNLNFSRKNDSLTGAGRWWVEKSKQSTHIAGKLKSNSLDKTLELFDIKSTIIGSKAQADFSLTWPGNPMDFALAHLSGELDLKLKQGRITDINPGFGRILSLLSIQSLERRLRLDFSDVFEKGFSFDEITALITVTNGKAHSDNLLLTAPSADIKMKGDVNLGTKALHLTANVIAQISGTLPLAATIASGGNPIVGALGFGVWAMDKLVKSQGGDSGSTYYITGTWEKPIVKGK